MGFSRFLPRARALRTEVWAIALAARDPRTPLLARLLGGIAVAYALSPIDLIPDFIPVLGQLDDLILVPALFALVLRMVPPAVMRECREKAAIQTARVKRAAWIAAGFTETMKTPDATLIFVTPPKAEEIRVDQIDCMGCLSACAFSNWSQNEEGTTGRKADPRSFCIQKTLQEISHSDKIDDQLMFAGHNAYRFASDPFYANGFVPTVKQLVERLMTGY